MAAPASGVASDVQPARDHSLPPDPDAWRRADHPHGRVVVIAPTRAACETIELALHAEVETLLARRHGDQLRAWARGGKGFGIVAGTGTGKTLGIRFIAQEILGESLQIGVVNREREATPETTRCNVVVVTTGIARRWLTDGILSPRDTLVVDEIHQTSAELELCLALGKRLGCRFIWLSATVDPEVYRRYLSSDEVLVTDAFDPALKARVELSSKPPELYLDDRTVRRFVSERRGVAVFLPTRAEVERLGAELGARFPRLTAAFYHGGEPIRVVRPFLEGTVPKPWLLAMTAAGQSALNVPGLDTVVILDARYANVVDRGRNVLHRLPLGPNEMLQMAGRVHGRVAGGQVVILSEREIDFASLRPGPPEFQLAGDAERVAITCAEIGVDARDLDLPVPLDRVAYVRAVELLTQRGLIEAGRLTRYGRSVEAVPVERPWAEPLVHASDALLPLVAGASGIGSLHRMTRDERDLHGVVVSGSDHLTAYNLLAEAVNGCGRLGEVHGLPRHVFDEEQLERWAERRGVLMKSIEDGALGMAAVYRALDQTLPDTLPYADKTLRADFVDLVARIQPFDLVIDEQTADGQPARIAKSSVAGSWGAVAGSLRWFADRMGVPRAAIEGTTIPHDLVHRHAVPGPPRLEITGHRQRQGLSVARPLVYFGFPLETSYQRLPGPIPPEFQESARTLLDQALLAGDAEHPDRGRIVAAGRRLRDYWPRSGGVLDAASSEALTALIRAQLGDVSSWQEFQQTPVRLDVEAIVSDAERRHLDALPSKVRLAGDTVPVEYVIHGGVPTVRVHLREGQAARLRDDDVPRFDRPVLFTLRRGDSSLEAATPHELRRVMAAWRPPREERHHASRRGRGGGRPKGPGGRPPRRGGRGPRRRS
jgi:hypothetical protein